MSLIPYAGANPVPKKKNFETLANASLKAELANMQRKYESALALAESREAEIKRGRYAVARLEQRLEEIAKMAQCEPYSRAPRFTESVLPSAVLKQVAAFYGLRVDAITGHGRARDVTRARHIAIYLIRKMTGDSTIQIGRYLGGRDHSTVLHAMKNIEEGIKIDPLLANQVMDIRDKLEHSSVASRAVELAAAPSSGPPLEKDAAAISPSGAGNGSEHLSPDLA